MQVLDYDSSTYQTFHRMTLEWPCLSFDILRDGLGDQREEFPLTAYTVAGTQADTTQPDVHNSLLVMKMSQMHRTQHDSDDSAEESDSDDDDGDAVLEHRAVRHPGAVNRVRCQKQSPNIVATWSETGSVQVYDVAQHLAALDGPLPLGQPPPQQNAPPLQAFQGVQTGNACVFFLPVGSHAALRRAHNGGFRPGLVSGGTRAAGERRLRWRGENPHLESHHPPLAAPVSAHPAWDRYICGNPERLELGLWVKRRRGTRSDVPQMPRGRLARPVAHSCCRCAVERGRLAVEPGGAGCVGQLLGRPKHLRLGRSRWEYPTWR